MICALVVEDKKGIRHILVDLLEDMSHEVGKADNRAVALQRVREETSDVVIVDIIIPVMERLLFITKLRDDLLAVSISVVLVTTVNLTDVIMKSKAVGIKHLLPKPWEQRPTDIIFAQAI